MKKVIKIGFGVWILLTCIIMCAIGLIFKLVIGEGLGSPELKYEDRLEEFAYPPLVHEDTEETKKNPENHGYILDMVMSDFEADSEMEFAKLPFRVVRGIYDDKGNKIVHGIIGCVEKGNCKAEKNNAVACYREKGYVGMFCISEQFTSEQKQEMDQFFQEHPEGSISVDACSQDDTYYYLEEISLYDGNQMIKTMKPEGIKIPENAKAVEADDLWIHDPATIGWGIDDHFIENRQMLDEWFAKKGIQIKESQEVDESNIFKLCDYYVCTNGSLSLVNFTYADFSQIVWLLFFMTLFGCAIPCVIVCAVIIVVSGKKKKD